LAEPDEIALVYLARGADPDAEGRFARFVASHAARPAGAPHRLYVLYKGYATAAALERARRLFAALPHAEIHVADDSFDLGAYRDACASIPEPVVCFLNTNSEILAAGWLARLHANLARPGVGMVGATASFESLAPLDPIFPAYPNPHVRSNAIMLRRETFAELLAGRPLRTKLDAFLIESGPDSMTRRLWARGQEALVVGRDGRGYAARWWPHSETFRRVLQRNLLVADNVTRAYDAAPWLIKHQLAETSWRTFMDGRAYYER
jgi:hypothetical protein